MDIDGPTRRSGMLRRLESSARLPHGSRLMRQVGGPRQLRDVSLPVDTLVLGQRHRPARTDRRDRRRHEGDTEVPPLRGLVEDAWSISTSRQRGDGGDWAIRVDDPGLADVLMGFVRHRRRRRPGAGCRHARSDEWPRHALWTTTARSTGASKSFRSTSPASSRRPRRRRGPDRLGWRGVPRWERPGHRGDAAVTLPNTDTAAVTSATSSDVRPALGLTGLLAIGSLFVASRRRRNHPGRVPRG